MALWDAEGREAVQALIPEVEGKPCVNVGTYDGGAYVCRRIPSLGTDEDSFNGTSEWVDHNDARPDELTEGMRSAAIASGSAPAGGRTRTSGGTSCTSR